MAEAEDIEHGHTDDEHDRHADQAHEIFSTAIQKCVDAKLCETIVYEELVMRVATEAVVHDIALSELVAAVIETYLELKDDDVILQKALTQPVEKLHGN